MQMEQRFQVGKMMGAEMMECISACQTTHAVVVETIQHCLKQGGKHAEPSHIRMLMDCAQICQTSADFMLRGSDFHGLTCGVCAEVCQRCAESCSRLDGEMLKRCADACTMCAESCNRMAEKYSRTHM